MGALRKRFGAVRPENGNVMDWLSSLVSTLPSPLTRECPRPDKSVVVPLIGLGGGSWVELGALSYSIVASDTLSNVLNGRKCRDKAAQE
jgi:hypothetical protein